MSITCLPDLTRELSVRTEHCSDGQWREALHNLRRVKGSRHSHPPGRRCFPRPAVLSQSPSPGLLRRHHLSVPGVTHVHFPQFCSFALIPSDSLNRTQPHSLELTP